MNTSPVPQSAGRTHGGQAVACENLRFAVSDHQEMIRGADLKAEVLGILLTAACATITWEGHLSTSTPGGWLGILGTLFVLLAFYCVGGVLWPRSDPWRGVPLGEYAPSRVLYPPVEASPGHTVVEHASRALNTDWPNELAYELLKLSGIRSAKQKWFQRALIASAASLLVIAVRLLVQ